MSRAEWEHREGEEAMTKYRPSQGQHQEPGSHRLFHSGANLNILESREFCSGPGIRSPMCESDIYQGNTWGKLSTGESYCNLEDILKLGTTRGLPPHFIVIAKSAGPQKSGAPQLSAVKFTLDSMDLEPAWQTRKIDSVLVVVGSLL